MGWLDDTLSKFHFNKKCTWSLIEQFRYLETLYDLKPDLFPKISNEEFESKRNQFYNNQPIVATHPLT